ncbi:MAG: patatin-like phospholipase family protein [Sedimentisphaerales bacterium]
MTIIAKENLSSSKENKLFRILSLDGGGAKGVYTLGVLKEVEAICQQPLYEIFDLIYGTSTGAIISSLIALGYNIKEIEKIYFETIPNIMSKRTKGGRTRALQSEAKKIYGDRKFAECKTHIGIVCTNYDFERPMIFKKTVSQAHGSTATFQPGFGSTIADAVIASCAAYPFFKMVKVKTENQGEPLIMDGGYVANNPTLFALADASNAFKKNASEISVLSVGVGSYNEPKRSIFHEIIFSLWPFRHIAKMFNISSKTIEQLRIVLFPNIACVRINEAYPQPEYATDLLESDLRKLRVLQNLGRDSFAKYEKDIREKLKI